MDGRENFQNETLLTYSSKPVKEPLISVSDFDNLAADLNKSKCQSTLLLAIDYYANDGGPGEV